jgi:23S rRNA (adenine2503-C2)-methyltransferase
LVVKKDIRSLSIDQLKEILEQNSFQSFRAKQIYHWLWKKSSHDFSSMHNLPKKLLTFLENNFVIRNIEISKQQKSKDGTIKNAIKLFDDLIVECVLIPSKDRITACISSQVGCSLNCKFCATARLKRMRNLNADEIYDQVVLIAKQSQDFYKRPLTNIVFMGMGEPLMNYKNVTKAIEMITSNVGLGMSSKRIVLSTSGVPKMIKKMADDNVKFKLAVSLHSAIDETRTRIMPFNAKMDLTELGDSLEYWYDKTKSLVTYEYVVWKGVNDKEEDISALVNFCKKIPSKVNLIQYNSIDDPNFIQASNETLSKYISLLEKNNITATIRMSRGNDIDAACGQLANK